MVPLSRLHWTTKRATRLAGRFGRCRSSQAIIVVCGLTMCADSPLRLRHRGGINGEPMSLDEQQAARTDLRGEGNRKSIWAIWLKAALNRSIPERNLVVIRAGAHEEQTSLT